MGLPLKLYNFKTKYILIFFISISFISFAQNEKESEVFTVFYNVENLFDTIDCPEKNDAEFLPNGKKKWEL